MPTNDTPDSTEAEATIVSAAGSASGKGDTSPATAPVIVSAVGTAVKSSVPGLSSRLEAVMVAAVVAAQAEGVTDPDEIKARKQAALDAELETVRLENEASAAAARATDPSAEA